MTWGVRDLSCYGSQFHESPHIDRLADEGVRFANAYAPHPVLRPITTSDSYRKTPGSSWRRGCAGRNVRHRPPMAKYVHHGFRGQQARFHIDWEKALSMKAAFVCP